MIILSFKTDFHHDNGSAAAKKTKPSSRRSQRAKTEAMPGPAQLECMKLKVLLRNKEEVRAALRSKGFSASRAAQLLADCEQSPPRSPVQRARQTAQDPPPKKIICLPRKKYCNSTNDAPSTIYIYIIYISLS